MPEANLFLDKRLHSRVLVKIPVTFRLMDDHKEITIVREMGTRVKTGQTMDTSLGGMYIVAETPLKTGDILSLKISIPGRTAPTTAFAEVMWSNATGAGIRFLAMKEEDIKLLEAFLESLAVSS